jgi:hypothetical protein
MISTIIHRIGVILRCEGECVRVREIVFSVSHHPHLHRNSPISNGGRFFRHFHVRYFIFDTFTFEIFAFSVIHENQFEHWKTHFNSRRDQRSFEDLNMCCPIELTVRVLQCHAHTPER